MVKKNNPNDPVFYLPDLGEGLDEADLIEWTVNVGQKVEENDILAKMETAKALVDLPSPRGGVIAELHGKAGQAIKVGAPLVTFASDAAGGGGSAAKNESKPVTGAAQASFTEGSGEAQEDAGTVVGNLSEAAAPGDKPMVTPAVRKQARDLGVDLAGIRGTGINGRITAEDVRGAAGGGERKPVGLKAGGSTGAGAEGTALRLERSGGGGRGDVRIPFRGVRKTIAERLRQSVSRAVHFTVMDEANVSDLDHTRRKLIAASNEKISLLPLVAAAVCRLLSGQAGGQFARLNSTLDDEKQEILQHGAIHLGIATDTENGLMVPVVRDADRMGVLELGRKIAQLAEGARARTLQPEQLMGSTFTISNFGAMGGRFATPIINYPETGILALGRARDGVVARNGMLGVGKLLPLSLTADHRVIDGGAVTAALNKLVELLEAPEELLRSESK